MSPVVLFRGFLSCNVVPSAPINVKTVTNNSIPTRLLIRWQVCTFIK